MKRNTLRRTGAAGAAVLALSFGLAACGDDADDTPSSSSAPAETESSEAAAASGAGAETFGEGCSAIPSSGKGSFDGMVTDPVATAASNNPLLKTLVATVSGAYTPGVNLVDTLNGDEFTVFAPVDEAFAKVDPATLEKLKTDAELLSSILTYHVVPGQLDPESVVGTQKSVQGYDVEVTGEGDNLKVNDAKVICGGVQTENATVYLIDSVLMPTM